FFHQPVKRLASVITMSPWGQRSTSAMDATPSTGSPAFLSACSRRRRSFASDSSNSIEEVSSTTQVRSGGRGGRLAVVGHHADQVLAAHGFQEVVHGTELFVHESGERSAREDDGGHAGDPRVRQVR